MDYSQYEPPIIDGIINYGEMHAKRKQDAMKAWSDSGRAEEGKKVLTIRCRKSHELAWVDNCPQRVIKCFQSKKIDASLRNLRGETGNHGIEYVPQTYFDFLDAGDDLDLEVMCHCGGMKTLDRELIRTAISAERKTLIAN